MVRNFSNDKYNITDKFGEAMTIKILNFMREQLKEFQDRSGNLYNLEATPDFQAQCYTSIVDHRFTDVKGGKMLKLLVWYDNEWSYASKVVDIVKHTLI